MISRSVPGVRGRRPSRIRSRTGERGTDSKLKWHPQRKGRLTEVTDDPTRSRKHTHRALVVRLERVLDRTDKETDSGTGQPDVERWREGRDGVVGLGDCRRIRREERSGRERDVEVLSDGFVGCRHRGSTGRGLTRIWLDAGRAVSSVSLRQSADRFGRDRARDADSSTGFSIVRDAVPGERRVR